MRYILNSLPKFTTCTFHIHITMYCYRLQCLGQLDNSIRHLSNSTFYNIFRKDFQIWFRYGVPLFSLSLLDICKI